MGIHVGPQTRGFSGGRGGPDRMGGGLPYPGPYGRGTATQHWSWPGAQDGQAGRGVRPCGTGRSAPQNVPPVNRQDEDTMSRSSRVLVPSSPVRQWSELAKQSGARSNLIRFLPASPVREWWSDCIPARKRLTRGIRKRSSREIVGAVLRKPFKIRSTITLSCIRNSHAYN